ncbi:MAG: asparagine synthase-related protein [Erythrobacter sp.]
MRVLPFFVFGSPHGGVSEQQQQRADTGKKDSEAPALRVGGRYCLKNRAALAQTLGLTVSASDAEIIGAGWHRWRCDLADHLRGSFAFVLHEPATDTLYAARDALGNEPLYLAFSGARWIFGDNPRNVRVSMPVEPGLDDLAIADFLMGEVVDRHHTYFQGIERLPAGHWTKITSEGRVSRQYWSVSDAPKVEPCSEPARRFGALFDHSVGYHSEHCNTLGVFVSGGMDSSSILATVMALREQAVQVLGLTRTYGDLPQWSDGRYVALLKERFAFEHQEIGSGSVNPLDQADRVIAAHDGPVLAYGFAATIPLYEAARTTGVRVVLDGHGGDEVVSFGMGLFNELARDGQWLGFWRATRAVETLYGASRLRWLMRYMIHVPIWKQVRDIRRGLSRTSSQGHTPSILSPELEALVGKNRYQRADPMKRIDHTERDLHEFALGSPMQQYAQELLVLVGRAYGVECRMPFLDRDLAEFSLSLEAKTKLHDGLTRVVLREAMAERLPRLLLERPDKFDFSDVFAKGLLQDRERLMDLTDPSIAALSAYVNPARLAQLRREVHAGADAIDTHTARTLFRVAQLSIWLQSLR